MTHRLDFNTIIDEFNKNNINYTIIRGFMLLPKTPDSDLDIIIEKNDFDKTIKILETHCYKREGISRTFNTQNKSLIYHSFRTKGPFDNSISNGCFQFDIYNYCFNYEGRIFNVANDLFHTYLFNNRILRNNYYIPSPGAEILLLFFRGFYDHNKNWQHKHNTRICELYNEESKIELYNILEYFDTFIKKEIIKYIKTLRI
tara:strand:- start:4220 stop:4822 length:603 start_codon:yes stop_codon:yes gene_type:complete